jgi:IMP dehydrogenase
MSDNSDKVIGEGLSFDDVTLIPAKAEVLPKDTDVTTRLSRHIRLAIPIISAAMDMVTESRLAIALAREGGLGIIHKNLPIERQAEEVDKVKRSESGMIIDPVTLGPTRRVQEALQIMAKFHISGLPITQDGKLVGILTNRDLRFETALDRPVFEVMTKDNLVTAPEGTTLEEAKAILHKHRIEKLPVVKDGGELAGLITIKDIEKVRAYPNACKDTLGRLRVGAAVGVGADTMDRAQALVEKGCDVLVVDSAHGHSVGVLRTLELLKERFPQTDVIAGNVSTTEGARALCEAGADAIKVGMGPGATCTTRVISGAGVPQITAVLDSARAAEPFDVPIIADGGIKYSGDLTKAMAAGAHSVMIGMLFAGTEESPGETVLYMGRTFKQYRGMGSLGALKLGGRDRYAQEDELAEERLVPQGIEGRVSYRGPLSGVVHQLVGGLRAGMGFCGVRTIGELRANVRMLRITPAGLRESHPHDMVITEEAPNYQIPEFAPRG